MRFKFLAISVISVAMIGAGVPAAAATQRITPPRPLSPSATGSPRLLSTTGTRPGMFVAVAPARILDTRTGLGGNILGAAATLKLSVAGQGGIPLDGVGSVVLNVTATQPRAPGYVTVWSTSESQPDTSNLSFAAGATVSNQVIAQVGADGKVNLRNGSTGTIQLVADVSGYYPAGQAQLPGAFVPLAPHRLVDTRTGMGSPSDTTEGLDFRVSGADAIAFPAVESAVVLDVTATAPTEPGYLTVFQPGTTRPATSDLNFVARQTVSHLVVVADHGAGSVVIYTGSQGTVQIIVDIIGYLHGGSPGVSGASGPVTATRLLDTRSSPGQAVGSQKTVALTVVGRGGIPATGVTSVLANVTTVDSTSPGYLTIWPGGGVRPTISSINFDKKTPVSNEVLVPVGADGRISLFNGAAGSVQVIVDIAGYVIEPSAPIRGTAGTVFGYGDDSFGAVGNGDAVAPTATPSGVLGLTSVVRVAGGGLTEYAVESDGTAWAWGDNGSGELGNGSMVRFATAPVQVAGLTGVVSIAGGNYTGFAVTADGHVWAWGVNDLGQLGDDQREPYSRVPLEVPGLTGAVDVAAGAGGDVYVLKGDGTVWAWGYNYWGAVGDGTYVDRHTPVQVVGLTGVTAIAAGGNAGYALLGDGTVQAWGVNGDGQLGNGTAPGGTNSPGKVVNLSAVTAIAADGNTVYALTSDETVHAWGNNTEGQLGNGSTDTISRVPVSVVGISDVKSIGTGLRTAFAALGDGTVWAWGYGDSGELGQGPSGHLSVPGPVQGLPYSTAVSANSYAGYAILG